MAAALLVKGYAEGGGGFAAGVVASLAVMLQYFAVGLDGAERQLPWTSAALPVAIAGVALMAIVVLWPLTAGMPPATHWPRPGEEVIELGLVELHTALLFETGMALGTFGFAVASLHQLAAVRREASA